MKILLLPGLRGDAAEFGPLLALLPRARFQALPRSRATTLAAIAAELAAAGGLAADLIIGASFGGLVARALVAGGHTGARLLLVGTLPHPGPPAAARRCRPLGRLVSHLPDGMYRRGYAQRATREWAEDTSSPWPGDLPPAAVVGARLQAIAAWGLPPIPPGTIVAWGLRDRFVTWSEQDVVRWGGVPRPLPGAHRPHLSGPGHLVEIIPSVGDPGA